MHKYDLGWSTVARALELKAATQLASALGVYDCLIV